jgi:hypothetical protein
MSRVPRHSITVELRGQRMTLAEACRVLGLPYQPILWRIKEGGWDIERALTQPIRQGNSRLQAVRRLKEQEGQG